MSVFLRAGLVVLVAAITGCSSSFKADPLQGEEIADVAVLGVMPINWQDNYEMRVMDNPVGLLGTAGRVVVEKGRETRSRDLTAAVNEAAYDYRDHFTRALGQALLEEEFRIEPMAYKRKPHPQAGRVLKGRFEAQENYPAGRTPYGAFLDIYVDYVGMGSASISTQFTPTYHVGVRVVDGDDGEILYQQRIEYSSFADEDEEVIRIAPNPDYSFEDYNDILGNIERARDGMREAVDSVAKRIADDLAKARDEYRAQQASE